MQLLNKKVPFYPLFYFRVVFGFLSIFLLLRYFIYGWISKYFIEPIVFFPHFNWNWLTPLPGFAMYGVFIILFIISIFIILGIETRLSILVFSLLFAYQHLIDKANFLNHYYLIFLFSLILLMVPSETLPALLSKNGQLRYARIPAWAVYLVRFQLGIVYTFGAIAKMRPDWILDAQPLKIWLLMNRDLPIIGGILAWKITPYLFSYAGLIFDLFIFPALLIRKTRKIAYFFVILFHILTFLLFPIGMFPWIMLLLTPVCFSNRFHYSFYKHCAKITENARLWLIKLNLNFKLKNSIPIKSGKMYFYLALALVILEIVIPFRHFLFPGNLLWTEEGFRFSWHIMAAHKSGVANFFIHEKNGIKVPVNYNYLLTQRQIGQMSTDPGMIWQFAKEIDKKEKEKGRENYGVYVENYVSLNGKPAKLQIDPKINLLEVEYNYFEHTDWIINGDL